MSVKKLFEKVEMKQELITVSDTQKGDLSIMVFCFCFFAAQCSKDLKRRKHQKRSKQSVSLIS